MASLADVLNIFVSTITTALYPTPPVAQENSPAVGVPVVIEPGWPVAQTLEARIAAGITTISVWPMPTERNTSRMQQGSWSKSVSVIGTTFSVSGKNITFGGAPVVGDIIGITLRPGESVPLLGVNFVLGHSAVGALLTYDGVGMSAYSYAVQQGNDASAIAAYFATQIPGSIAVGPVLTVSTISIDVELAGTFVVVTELKRQDRTFQVTIWTSDPAIRDTVADFVDVVLASNYRLLLPDSSQIVTRYVNSVQVDTSEKVGIYRRDLMYAGEWPTTKLANVPGVVAIDLGLAPL